MIVLIVEDEKEVTELWSRFLKEIADEIRIAYDPEEGLVLMAQAPRPEVVLLDLGFPASRPNETLSVYLPKFRELNPEATIVIVTGNTEESIMELSKQLGDHFAQKPMHANSQDKLLRAVHTGSQVNSSRHPSYTQPLRVLEILNKFLNPKLL